MKPNEKSSIPPDYTGTFAHSNPNLNDYEMLDNMANINLLTRQQKVMWPEFSWMTILGDEKSRCYQMFAPDISRLGYNNAGRVYSIICPQQGTVSPTFGTMNVEVTVTGQRGWADESVAATNFSEDPKNLLADMTVEGTIWFSPSANQKPLVKFLWSLFANSKLPFPSDKANAIKVNTYNPGEPEQPIFPLYPGETDKFPIPEFARHTDEAWAVGNLGVEIGTIRDTDSDFVNEFNQLIMDIFNMGSGNMLKNGNVLTWNVWFKAPELVDQEEWQNHADYWRESIQADHGSPEGEGGDAMYFDGTKFSPIANMKEIEEEKIGAFFRKNSVRIGTHLIKNPELLKELKGAHSFLGKII